MGAVVNNFFKMLKLWKFYCVNIKKAEQYYDQKQIWI